MKISEFFLAAIASLVLLQLIVLISLYDLFEVRYEQVEKFDQVSVGTLKVDTIHAEEIEIFPLCDLDGNIVCE